MAKRKDREALFGGSEPQPDPPTPTPPTEATEVQIPVLPAAFTVNKLNDELALIRGQDIKVTTFYTIDRAQCLELGAALIKVGNAMASPKQLLKAEKRLLVPGQAAT